MRRFHDLWSCEFDLLFLKEKLEKAILERADATSRSKSLECSLQMAQDELKRFEEQNEQHKQEIQQLVQSLDERRSLLAEFELKFRVKKFLFDRCLLNEIFHFRILKLDVSIWKMNDNEYKLSLKIIINEHII